MSFYGSLDWLYKRPINFKTHFRTRRHEHLPFKDEWFASFLQDHCTILISWRKTFSMSNKELTNSKAKFCFEHIYGSTNSKIYFYIFTTFSYLSLHWGYFLSFMRYISISFAFYLKLSANGLLLCHSLKLNILKKFLLLLSVVLLVVIFYPYISNKYSIISYVLKIWIFCFKIDNEKEY